MEVNPGSSTAGQPVSLRPAAVIYDEGLLFARYLNTAAEGFFRFMLGDNYLDILASAYLQPAHDLSYENVTFAEIDGRVVGMFSGFSAEEHQSSSKDVLIKAAGTWNLRFLFVSTLFSPLIRIIDTVKDDDFYLQAIAVEENVRGQGVGSILLDSVEMMAPKKGARRIALVVHAVNSVTLRVAVRLRIKTCFAGNGKPLSRNTTQSRERTASPEGPQHKRFVRRCSPCKGLAIHCGLRLAQSACAVAEHYRIYRMGH